MIFIFCAMYQEARPLIRKLNLKKCVSGLPWQDFRDRKGKIRLTVMGIGPVAAAACVGSVLGTRRSRLSENQFAQSAGDPDHLVLFGTAAGNPDTEGLFLINRLTNADSGRTFYPDLLIRSDLPEAEIITSSRIMSPGSIRRNEKRGSHLVSLYDMEAAAVYEAGSRFLGPHQMSFLKVVSDHGVSLKTLSSLPRIGQTINNAADQALVFLKDIDRFLFESQCSPVNEQKIADETRSLSDAFCASEAMSYEIRQLLRYAYLVSADDRANAPEGPDKWPESLIRHFLAEPAKNRKEGKQRLNEFRRKLTL